MFCSGMASYHNGPQSVLMSKKFVTAFVYTSDSNARSTVPGKRKEERVDWFQFQQLRRAIFPGNIPNIEINPFPFHTR